MTDRTTTALAELLDHARRHVPYYQPRFLPAPVTPDNAVATLRRLPLLRRDLVRRERPRLWSAVGDPRRWRTVHTTGTTGAPLEIVVDEAAQRAELASLLRHVESCAGGRSGFSVVHLTLHLASVSRTSVAPDPPGISLSKWNLSRAWQLPDEEFGPAVVEELAGQVITAMPSVMAALCARLGRWPGRLAPPRLVVLSGEHVTPDVRARVTETFGCPVTALYTLAEAGIAGHACEGTDTYHVDEAGAFVEVVDGAGQVLPAGVPGDIAVTPLANRAMPLLRYLPGDTGVRVDGSCGCGRTGPRLRLLSARSERVVVTGPSGRGLRMIDLAKLCRQLDLGVTRVVREGDVVVLEHRDERPASPVQRTVVTAAVRSLLGAELTVRTRQVPGAPPRGGPSAPTARSAGEPGAPYAGPALPAPEEIAAWARRVLAGEPDVRAAVLTGSALDSASVSRFSDIDMTVVVAGDPYDAYWRSRATAMNRGLATLRVNVTLAEAVSRTPLVACRLLSERHPVVGSLERAGVAWPTREALAAEGRFWAQTAENILWTRVTAADRTRTDPLRDAWLASRFCLDALRYTFLCEGIRVTSARSVLKLAVESGVPQAEDIGHAFAVGREHRPPPMAGTPEADRFLLDALSCVRRLRDSL
ncbi:AMP-binding protein [Streptomyces sp. NPDC057116]|uniref:AMP-binding protein n=1 Tax=Streptomyces sp. NPDC057116 TaxID=3346023 RepID=UPI00362FC96B